MCGRNAIGCWISLLAWIVAIQGIALCIPNRALAQTRVVGKSCGRCGRGVSITSQVGDRCPHCGAIWGYKSDRYVGYYSDPCSASFTPPVNRVAAQFARALEAQEAAREQKEMTARQARIDFGERERERLERRRAIGTPEWHRATAKKALPQPLSPSELSYAASGEVRIRFPRLLQENFSDHCAELAAAIPTESPSQLRDRINTLIAELRSKVREVVPGEYIRSKLFLQSLAHQLVDVDQSTHGDLAATYIR